MTDGQCEKCGKATKECYPDDGRFTMCECADTGSHDMREDER